MARKPLSAAMARNAVLVNQFATPGLGSMIAGRYFAGTGQLILAVAGVAFFVLWLVAIMRQLYGQIDGNVEVKPIGWIGLTGLILFAAAWLWALITSISIMREARRNRPTHFPPAQPPPLP